MGKYIEIFLKQSVIGIEQVSVWGVLPLIPVLIILIASIMVKLMQMNKSTPLQEIGVEVSKRYYKTENIYHKVDHVTDLLVDFYIILAMLPLLALFNAKFEGYIYGMLSKIDVMNNSIIGLTAMVITMVAVVVIFDKKYYLVFSIREVLHEYKVIKSLGITIYSCIISTVVTMTLLDQRLNSYFDIFRFMLLEVAVICNILSVTYSFYVITKVIFSEQKKEFGLLEKLYKMFWHRKIEKTYIKEKENWTKEAVNVNLEYLIRKYIEASKKIKTVEIEEIEFSTTLGCYKDKWYKKARVKLCVLLGVCLLISIVINISVLGKQCMPLILVNIITVIVSTIIIYIKPTSVQLVVLRLFLDTWGYYIRKTNGYERIVPRTALRKNNKLDKLFIIMNSLNAFMYILIDVVNEKELIEESLEEINKGILSLEEQNMVTYFPIYTIGFFAFNKGIELESIRNLYLRMGFSENDRYIFYRMLYSQVFYLTKNYSQEAFEYREKLHEYIEWISID